MKPGTKRVLTAVSTFICCTITSSIAAVEHSFSGIIDSRISISDTFDSYLDGGTGRFRYSDNSQTSIAQAGLKYTAESDNWSGIVIANGYLDGENNGLGITEAYLKYRGIPDENGLRFQFRGGIIYPQISLENIATAWVSPYSLTFSTQNTWLGEEVRHAGLEFSTDWLGKNRGSDLDVNLTFTAFKYNDPTGALLAWHGWTQSSRQSFWGEKLPFPLFPAIAPGQMLENQAHESDPFVELDSDFGFHLKGEMRWKRNFRIRLGHYDNQAADNIVKEGQYTWRTQFSHIGIDWKIDKHWKVIAQYMEGDTRMRVMNDFDVVGIDFTNAFALLTHAKNKHRYTIRYEQFNNEDFDGIWGDNNDDQGDSWTLSYQYRYAQGLYLAVEYNTIDSIRPARYYQHLPTQAKEDQLMLGVRYFF